MNIESKNFVHDLEKLLRIHNVDIVLDCYGGYESSSELTFESEFVNISFDSTSSEIIDFKKLKIMYPECFTNKEEKIMSEKETISGFDIEKRELTDEEKIRDITIDRIRDFHYAAGEDFLDYFSDINVDVFTGFLIAGYPEHSKEILSICNKENDNYSLEPNSYKEIEIFDFNEEEDIDNLYFPFVKFVNLTGHLNT